MRPMPVRIAKAIIDGVRTMTRERFSFDSSSFARVAIVFAAALLLLAGFAVGSLAHADAFAVGNSVALDPFDPVPQIRFSDCDDGCSYHRCYERCGAWRCRHDCGWRCDHDCRGYDRDPCRDDDCRSGWHCERDCGPAPREWWDRMGRDYDRDGEDYGWTFGDGSWHYWHEHRWHDDGEDGYWHDHHDHDWHDHGGPDGGAHDGDNAWHGSHDGVWHDGCDPGQCPGDYEWRQDGDHWRYWHENSWHDDGEDHVHWHDGHHEDHPDDHPDGDHHDDHPDDHHDGDHP